MRTKVCFLFFLLLVQFSASGQNTFLKTYQVEDNFSWGHSVNLVDSGFLVCGKIDSLIFLVRTNQYGDTLWTKNYGSISMNLFSQVLIEPTTDGGFIIATTRDTINWTNGALLVKLDSLCNVLWSKIYFNPGFSPFDIQQTSDHGYVVVGTGTSVNGMDICLMKTDSSGNYIWSKYYGSPDTDEGLNVRQTYDGGYIILCSTSLFGSNYDRGLIRTDANGNVIWSKGYGSYQGDPLEGRSVIISEDTGFVFMNSCCSGISVVKVDSMGSIIWDKSYRRVGPDQSMSGNCIRQTSDDGFIFSGTADGALLVKTNSIGDTLWVKRYEYGKVYDAYQVEQTRDSGFIVAASIMTDTMIPILKDGILKTNASGVVGCFEEPFSLQIDTFNYGFADYNFAATAVFMTSLPTSVSLSYGSELNIHCNGLSGIQNANYISDDVRIFPNPASFSFTITNASGSDVRIFNTKIENIFSRSIKNDDESINCENLQPGIYFVQVQTKNGTSVQKLIKQ